MDLLVFLTFQFGVAGSPQGTVSKPTQQAGRLRPNHSSHRRRFPVVLHHTFAPSFLFTLLLGLLILCPLLQTARGQIASQDQDRNASTTYPAPKTASLEGRVINAETGERLPAANIGLAGLMKGTSSDAGGSYILDRLAPGTYTLVSSYIGFVRFERVIHVEAGEQLQLDIRLKPDAYRLGEMVVESKRNIQWRHHVGAARIEATAIKGLPSVFQKDLFRSLQLLPGVTSSSDFSSGLYIRGGSPDQTLVLLDGAPVYNPSHFFGFYSTFNPEAIGDLQLYKGNFPAQYGGRLGSVLSLNQKQGSREETGGSVSVGLLSAGASMHGPLPVGKGSWMLAARRSTLDPLLGWLGRSYEDIPEQFYLLDLNGKLHLDLNQRNNLDLSFYSGRDDLSFPFAADAGINLEYGNQIASANWKHLFSDRLLTTFHLSGSRYFNYPEFTAASTRYLRSNTIFDLSFRSDTKYLLNDAHRLSFGIGVGQRRLQLQDHYDRNRTFDSDVRLWNSSVYVEDAWSLSEEVTATPGLRLNQYGVGNPLQVEPRVSLEYRPAPAVQLQAGWGKYSQDLTLISNESFTGMDVWMASGDDIAPSHGHQYAVGLTLTPGRDEAPSRHSERAHASSEGMQSKARGGGPRSHPKRAPAPHSRPEQSPVPNSHPERAERVEGSPGSDFLSKAFHGLTLNLELYYRTMKNLFEPDPLLLDQAGLPYSALFRFGEGHAYGAEVSLERSVGSITGFIGYTFSKTHRRFPEVSEDYYPTRFDRTHNLSVVLEHDLNATWSVTGVFNFTSGAPYTKVVGRSLFFNSPLSDWGKFNAVTGKKNAARMPAYHRLDLGVTRQGTFFGMGNTELNLQLLNAYSRRNIWFYNYDLDKAANYKDPVQLLPLLPSISYNIYF